MRVLGIDGGLDGGLAVLDGEHLTTTIMPTVEHVDSMKRKRRLLDLDRLRSFIVMMRPESIWYEVAFPLPRQGVSSTFLIGRCFGALEGLVTGLGYARHPVPAREWQDHMLRGVARCDDEGAEIDTKARALRAARAAWPAHHWLPTRRSRVPHDGMVDAALIAEYGRRASS